MNLKGRYIFFFSVLGVFAAYLLIFYTMMISRGNPVTVPSQSGGFAERGPILDRNGRFLALQIRFADVSIWRPSISDIDVLSIELEDLLEMPASEIREKINSSQSNFLYLKRQIDDASARRLSSLLVEKKITGVMVQPFTGRVYPEKNLASQVIGFVGDRNEGIEYAFNDVLSGLENDGKGSQVVLTIDTNVQYILEQIAERTMNETGAEAVMFLAMDPRSGDILGSASLPGFDPNNIRASNVISRMNRPVIWAYEPGSVFKVFTLAAMIDSGAIDGNSVFYCNGSYTPARGSPINCLGVHGRVTARDIIIHSCNAGAAHASESISSNAFYNLLSNYGFGSDRGRQSRRDNGLLCFQRILV